MLDLHVLEINPQSLFGLQTGHYHPNHYPKAITQHGEATCVIAELGIGTNPPARLQGNIITDEKVLGTIHVAIVRNDFMGGKNIATTHIDGVVGQPNVEIDCKTLIEN